AFRAAVYPVPAYVESLATAQPIAAFVAVDAELRGCPIDPGQLVELLTAVTTGRRPQLPDQSVCLDCKRRGVPCVLVTRGLPCLGPVTQTGCGAICPAFGRACYGCFGPRGGASVDALAAAFAAGVGGRPGRPDPEVGRLFAGFTGATPAFRSVTDRLGGRPPRELAVASARHFDESRAGAPSWGPTGSEGDDARH
ncbi:MAG TPA: hypothetical protein VF484_04490, partial [Candidatus Limnocylindrales bacterium]